MEYGAAAIDIEPLEDEPDGEGGEACRMRCVVFHATASSENQ
jgi:hypothetical protein